MKKLFIVVLLIVFAGSASAQTFAEWFRQTKTQKKYLLQQIAALETYIGYLQKGYSIAKNGQNTISDIKNGELNLHDAFFNSLKSVNPSIRKNAKIADMIAMQVNIIHIYNRDFKRAKDSNAFNSGECSYIKRVYKRLLDDCSVTIDELIKVTTSGNYEMKDDERLKRIDALYNDIQDKYTFVKRFGNETMGVVSARAQEKNDVKTSRAINGIQPTP